MYSEKSFQIVPFISLYSFTHLVVDAACAFLLLGVLDIHDHPILSILLYNAIAFVLQAPLGFLIDKGLSPKLAAIAGLIFIIAAFLSGDYLFVALILVSLGNALFHVGGGSQVLALKEKKASFTGIYVAPGGIGLVIGSLLAFAPFDTSLLLFPGLLVVLGAILYFVKTPEFKRVKEPERKKTSSYYIALVITLILIPIIIRSLIGLSIDFPWKENQLLYLSLVLAIALGKAFGGFLADKFGLEIVGVGGLLLSMPLLAFCTEIPVLGILGAFIFNFTMPVTLIAILNTIPEKRGLSFGLSTTALFIGALPVILGHTQWLDNNCVVFSLILLAAIILLTAFYLTKKNRNGI
ncbi:MAG: hypothetical protein LBV43_07360 [Prevotella sp.]|jgi:FSR family fosmidomycin resistance protein-like MFS transporter|nr:hypothetical protein [Prevotella sp.]